MLGVHCTIESSHFFFTCFVRGIQKPSSRKHHQKRRFYFKYAISVKTQKMHKKMSMCSPKVNPPWDVFPETRHQNPPHGSTNKFQQFPKAPMPKVIVRIQYLRKSPERSPRGVRSIGQIGALFFFGHLAAWRIDIEFNLYILNLDDIVDILSIFFCRGYLFSKCNRSWKVGQKPLGVLARWQLYVHKRPRHHFWYRNIMTEFLLAWEWQ